MTPEELLCGTMVASPRAGSVPNPEQCPNLHFSLSRFHLGESGHSFYDYMGGGSAPAQASALADVARLGTKRENPCDSKRTRNEHMGLERDHKTMIRTVVAFSELSAKGAD